MHRINFEKTIVPLPVLCYNLYVNIVMNIRKKAMQTIERLKLMHELVKRKLSRNAIETVVQIVEATYNASGYEKAEAKAKEIRELLESGISEAELLKKLKLM